VADYARDPAATCARGERGRTVARERFNPERVTAELVTIIDRELARKRRGGSAGGGGA
jgi:hypothetical protein